MNPFEHLPVQLSSCLLAGNSCNTSCSLLFIYFSTRFVKKILDQTGKCILSHLNTLNSGWGPFSSTQLHSRCIHRYGQNNSSYDAGYIFFVEILSFGFYIVLSECGAYLAVDHKLVYSRYPKMFLLFFSIILSLIPVLNPSFSIHISVLFSFFCFCLFLLLFFASGSIRILLSIFPSLQTLFIHF